MILKAGVLVTGAGAGIGRAIATAFASAGSCVSVCDRDEVAAETTADELRKRGFDAKAYTLDVTDVEQIRSVMAAIDKSSPLLTVVCNAGVALRKPTIEVEPHEYDRLMAVNLRGVFFTMQSALRLMLPRRQGNIITISSTSGFTASTGPMAAYDASKAGVRLLTAAIAREAALSGIRVNSVAPGTFETDLTRGLATVDQLQELAKSKIPMGRLGRTEEIGNACVFLASDAASYITGQTLAVDGGWLA
jgi:NAD(P)-dependent dehydrogenase (short-subunit alcohol dehydrogenase family)